MAAPESERWIVCDRCFARVTEGEAVCPECGAPLKGDAKAEVDSQVHSDLAHANLLRLRGDLNGAEAICLRILKRFPNEPETHVLLGDLCSDRLDWRRAAEWYELALDLNPGSAAEKAKLDEARRRIEEAETAQTVEQLGIPEEEHAPGKPWLIGAVAGVLVLAIVGATLANRGHSKAPGPLNGGEVSAPLKAPDTSDSSSTSDATSTPAAGSDRPMTAMSLEDRTMLDTLQKKSAQGSQIATLVEDPRDHALTITYDVPKDADPRRIGAVLAKDALDLSTDTLIVTVRGVSGDQLIYVADANRPKLTQIESPAFAEDNPNNPDAWISVLMVREWTAQPSASAPLTTSGEAGAASSTTGEAAPPSSSSSSDSSSTSSTSAAGGTGKPGG